jgi:hypothetical protein
VQDEGAGVERIGDPLVNGLQEPSVAEDGKFEWRDIDLGCTRVQGGILRVGESEEEDGERGEGEEFHEGDPGRALLLAELRARGKKKDGGEDCHWIVVGRFC